MQTDELREKYLAFFESKGCVRRPSDLLVPKDDPTVLFTPAGMNQFKNQFLGIGKLEFTKATTCQKCLRTGDIGNVGVTAYHHTFFEMLGNFSFGDYFKREAIHWAWEFLTDKKWLKLDPERLSVTVYLDDDEAHDIWRNEIKLPAERIRRDDEYENFWPAGAPTEGPDGVCGPCSEIYYHPPTGGKEVEIWNLVFTQFNRVGPPPDNLQPLPKKNIDTGMGLERTAAVLQGVESNFEIDILRPLCVTAGEIVGKKYAFDASHGRPLRRIADHVRAITFAIHEGVQPGNEKEAYVVRQLLRRALLEGFLLGKQEPFLFQLVPAVVTAMRHPYPDIAETAQAVAASIREEESQFLDTIERGVRKFDRLVESARSQGSSTIPGDDAFDLHQADGFLVELTQALAAKHNLGVDMLRFEELRARHKEISGSGAFADSVMAEGPIDALKKTSGGTEFLGYETTEATARILGIIAEQRLVDEIEEAGHDSPIGLVLDRTPFYAEAGGQVGDTGVITGEGFEFRVADTQRDGDLIVHLGHLARIEDAPSDRRTNFSSSAKNAPSMKVGAQVTAQVDATRRAGIRRAHSATHLLHHALRRTLGDQATQRGSKVEEDSFRFDFAHKGPLTADERRTIEDIINARIAEGSPVATAVMDLAEAKQAGAMALFGEKYPDRVRVVGMGDYSKEFCGGTHLENTGQVGVCRIVGEEPVAKGIRRVTALTGPRALARMREQEELLEQLQRLVKAPRAEDLPNRIEALQHELKDAREKLKQQSTASAADIAEDLIAHAETVNGVRIITAAPPGASKELLRDLIDRLRAGSTPTAVLLGTVEEGKVTLIAAVSKELVKQGVKANECVQAAAKIVGGGGGGRPDMAEAGGRDPEKLAEALEVGRGFYREKLHS